MTKRLLLSAFFATVFTLFGYAQNSDELTILLSENFDAFTEGSVEQPSSNDIGGTYSGKLYKTLGWSGRKVYEAGGALLVDDGGNITTKRFSGGSANGGVAKISMRVKAQENFGVAFSINYGSSYSYKTASVILGDNEWHDLSVVLSGGQYSSQLTFTSTISGFFIDDVKVETGASLVGAPEAQLPNKADGTSFTATWKAAVNASDYLLDVYSKAADGTKEYVLHDEAVTGTSKTVTGLDDSKTYFFTVRARNAAGSVSDYSEEIQVVKVLSSVGIPNVLPATNVTATSFTANWSPVADAKTYIATLHRTEKLSVAKDVDIISEDFSKVTEGTFNYVEFPIPSEGSLDEYTHAPGWYGSAHALAAGYMVLSPFAGEAALYTPSLDLSANNGAFTVNVNMAEAKYGTFSEGYEVTVNLYNDNREVPDETQKVRLDGKFSDYAITFTKGGKASSIEFVYDGNSKLYFDNIAVSQSLNAGDSYSVITDEKTVEGTSCDFDAELDNKSYSYCYTVVAVGETVEDHEIVSISSATSDEMPVAYSPETGINEAKTSAVRVATSGGKVVVALAADAPIAVYSLNGSLVANVAGKAGVNTIDTAEKVVVVKVAGKVFKIAK